MNIAPSPDANALYARRVTLQISIFIDGSSFADRADLIAIEAKLRELDHLAAAAL